MNSNSDGLLPELMGIEHEISVKFTPRIVIDSDLEFDDDYFEENERQSSEDLFSNKLYLQPNKTNDSLWGDDYSQLIKNGSVYKYIQDYPLEIATPECSDPKKLVAYRTAARLLVQKWCEELLKENSKELRNISIHERVIDTDGNSWGEHDNFSLDEKSYDWGYRESITPQLIWLHLLTRGCVTGAGRISGNDGSWSLSQKLPTVTNKQGKKWGSTGYNSYGERFEVRCSDKNVSEWAQLMRIGSFALIMAITKLGYDIGDLGVEDNFMYSTNAGNADTLHVDSDGNVRFTEVSKRAVEVQRRLAEIALDITDRYKFDLVYKKIANEWIRHCEDLNNQIHNKDHIDLSDFVYTDWAAKFYLVHNKLEKDKKNRLPRTPFDYESMSQDLTYDFTLLDAPIANGKVYTVEGYGYKLNKRIPTRVTNSKNEVEQALEKAPPGGKAEARDVFMKQLINSGVEVTSYDWDRIVWIDERGVRNERMFN